MTNPDDMCEIHGCHHNGTSVRLPEPPDCSNLATKGCRLRETQLDAALSTES